jgi:hypothetical protein
VDPEIQRFKDSVCDAERSTLIFNLNMGAAPLLNTNTISKKATLALASMAANVEKPGSTVPSTESIAAIDDVLSVTKGMSFYGTVTKTYRNPKDEESGSFCTVPVRYEFKDRETKNNAEIILRKTCNVRCATPYPAILRECIRQTSEHVRKTTGDEYVRVSVDTGNLSLRVSHRKDKKSAWIFCDNEVKLPKDVLNISARRVPNGFKMPLDGFLSDYSMETDQPLGATARQSRKDSAEKSPQKAKNKKKNDGQEF